MLCPFFGSSQANLSVKRSLRGRRSHWSRSSPHHTLPRFRSLPRRIWAPDDCLIRSRPQTNHPASPGGDELALNESDSGLWLRQYSPRLQRCHCCHVDLGCRHEHPHGHARNMNSGPVATKEVSPIAILALLPSKSTPCTDAKS